MQNLNFSLRNLVILVMLVFLFLQNYFFTNNDFISISLVLLSTIIMYLAISRYQNNNKKLLRVNAKEGSFLYNFLSTENTIFIKIISFILSVIFSTILVLTLKSISMSHGSIALFIIICIISFSIFSFISEDKTNSEVANSNLHQDVSTHANEFLHLILVSVVLTIILSLLLSAKDTFLFLNEGDIKLTNFIDYAYEQKINQTDNNYYSGILMNFYIILDYFKMAFANEFVVNMINEEDKNKYFYLFYLCIFILNMMKLFGFSVAFVFLQKGMSNFIQKLKPKIIKLLSMINFKKNSSIGEE